MRLNPFRSPAPLWRWATLYVAALACGCWMFSSCSSGGPVRRSDAPPPVTTPYTPPTGATYVGSEVCAGCHDKEAKALAKTFHGKKADPRSPMSKQECETCHGPGSVHAENGGGKGTIAMFGGTANQSPTAQTTKCLECHSKTWPEWQHGKHAQRDVSCTTCHSIHNPVGDHQLQEATQPELCARCHKQIESDLEKQSHHPLREGKMKCTDCHSPHGTATDRNLKADYITELCYKCHTEKRGPFLWEHPPVSENCLTCHSPHGSNHDKLLVAQAPFLCQRCHSTSGHPGSVRDSAQLLPGIPGSGVTPAREIFGNACMNCHIQIHGSNHPSGHLFER